MPLPRKPSVATLLLCVAVAVSCALLISLVSNLTFVSDDWELLVLRPRLTLDAVMQPFHEHIVLAPALIYRALLSVFGMDSALPYFAVSIVFFALSAVLLFAYARRRVGEWLALAAAIVVLFLGAASEDLLWAFQMGFFGSTACGLGMLLALDRGDRRGDAVAATLLVASFCFSSLGLPFAAGAAAHLLLDRRRDWRRAYVVIVPLLLYALWWLGWGHTAESHLGLGKLPGLPLYVFDAAAAGLGAMFGSAPGADGVARPDDVFRVLLVLCGLALAVRLARRRELPRGLLIALAIGGAFWFLAGLNRDELRFPTSLRYQYPSALFLLLIAIEALKGVRPRRLVELAAVAAACVAAVVGGRLLVEEYEDTWKPRSDKIRATLAAAEIAADHAGKGAWVGVPSPTRLPVRSYLLAASRSGSPAVPLSELPALSRNERAEIDQTLARVLGLKLAPAEPAPGPSSCRRIAPAGSGTPVKEVPFGDHVLFVTGPGAARIRVGRYGDGAGVLLGTLREGEAARLDLPAGRSGKPWRLSLAGSGRVALCRVP
jgi:hypothetical protein